MCNRGLKLTAAGQGIKLWEIAQKMGITDSTLSRKLRNELSEEDKTRFLKALNEIAISKKRNATEQ